MENHSSWSSATFRSVGQDAQLRFSRVEAQPSEAGASEEESEGARFQTTSTLKGDNVSRRCRVSARQRVVKPEAILATLGEEDETYPTLLAVLKKGAVAGAGATCVRANRIDKEFPSCGRRSAWKQARQVAVKAREALAEAVASQEKEEGFFGGGRTKAGVVVVGGASNTVSIHSTASTCACGLCRG